jgi:HK97 gp10 family phage protein
VIELDITIKIDGLRELEAALMALADEYGPKAGVQALRPAVKAAAGPVEQTIQATTPTDTGALAGTTKTRIGKPTKAMLRSEHYSANTVLAARVGWTWSGKRRFWNQALAVEFGNSKISGSATLRTAFDQHSQQMIDDFGKTLGPAIEKKAAQLHRKAR